MNKPNTPDQPSRRLISQGLGISLIATFFPGCSLGVMAGKMIMGDPLLPADFKTWTKVDLTKGKNTVLVICKAPDSVDEEYSTLAYDLIEGITQNLKLHGVKVINPDLVAGWLDEHGSTRLHPVRLAEDFETDYIIFIEVHSFSFREPNSPKLMRGQASGFIRAFEINEIDGHPHATTVYNGEFKSIYPQHQPISEQGRSSMIFEKEYLDRICMELSEKFYDHRPGTGF